VISLLKFVPDYNPTVQFVWKMAGVENVVTDQITKKVVVVGTMTQESVLTRARKVKELSNYWSGHHAY
jgi:hypothetical protein